VEAIYQKNLQALKKVNPELYRRLETIASNGAFEVFAGSDPLEVNLIDMRDHTPLYEKPVVDLNSQLQSFAPFYKYPFLCFFGLGNGFLIQSLLKNPGHQHLVVFEPEVEILFIALHLNDFAEAIEKLRLILIHPNDLSGHLAMSLTKLPGFSIYLKLYDLHTPLNYYHRYEEMIETVNQKLIHAIIQTVKSHGNDLEDSLIGLDHFLANLPDLLESVPFTRLRKKGKNSPLAITVATGPSLTKQLPLLKAIAEHVTIICVDASLPILEKWDIVPDIVTSLERVPLTGQFFQKTSEAFQKRVGCFALSAVQHREVIASVKGTRSIILRPFGYMYAFELDKFGYAGIGMSAANLAFELAFLLGFKRVVLLGQDLAYSTDEQTTHASDHLFSERDPSVVKRMESEERIYLPAWGGENQVRTNDTWVLFRNFFIQNIAETTHQMETIDATEGGCHIDGAIDMAFSEVVDRFVDRDFKKKPLALQIMNTKEHQRFIDHARKQKAAMIKRGEAALETLVPLQEKVATLCLDLEKMERKEQDEKGDFAQIRTLIQDIDRFKKVLEEPVFKKFFWESLRGLVINQELDIAKIVTAPVQSEKEQNRLNLDYLFAHRLWLFSVRGAIEAQLGILEKRVL
jgi:hypothetical protein